MGLVLSLFSQRNCRGFNSETSSYAPCHKINVNSGKADLVATLKKSTLPLNKCLLTGMQMMNFIRTIHELATLQPVLKQSMEELEYSIMVFARQSLHSIDSDKSMDKPSYRTTHL